LQKPVVKLAIPPCGLVGEEGFDQVIRAGLARLRLVIPPCRNAKSKGSSSSELPWIRVVFLR